MGLTSSRCVECDRLVSESKIDKEALGGPTCHYCISIKSSDDPEDRCSGCNDIVGKKNMKLVCKPHSYRACSACRENVGGLCTSCLLSWNF
jgi:hypothetical protein